MIDITYTLTPIKLNLDYIGISSRVLTENLLRDPNINPQFSKACLITNLYKTRNKKFKPDEALKYISGIENMIFSLDVMPSNEYNKIINNIKTDYVMLSIFSLIDLLAVKHLLNNDKKVIIGGVPTIIFSSDYIRYILKKMNSKNLHNLIIVSGYVDLTTDLYSIIKEWKDVKITKNNFKTVWDCTNDYLQKLRKIRKIANLKKERDEWWDNYEFISFALDLRCFWGKCKFCSYRKLPECDFRDDPDKIIKSIHETMEKYDSKTLRFVDSYFKFNEESLYILNNIKKSFNIEALFLGVLSFSNPEIVKLSNEYMQYYFIGLESFSTYQLKKVNKGYTEEHINKMIDNFIRYLKRDVFINFFMISDLPSKNINDVKENYEKAIKIKERLNREGFNNVRYTYQLLSLNSTELKNDLILYDNSIPSGQQRLIREFESKGMNIPDYVNDIYIPFNRGIPSDMDIIKKEDMNFLTSWN